MNCQLHKLVCKSFFPFTSLISLSLVTVELASSVSFSQVKLSQLLTSVILRIKRHPILIYSVLNDWHSHTSDSSSTLKFKGKKSFESGSGVLVTYNWPHLDHKELSGREKKEKTISTLAISSQVRIQEG